MREDAGGGPGWQGLGPQREGAAMGSGSQREEAQSRTRGPGRRGAERQPGWGTAVLWPPCPALLGRRQAHSGAGDKAEHLRALSDGIHLTDKHVLIIFHSSKRCTVESYVTFRKIDGISKQYKKNIYNKNCISNCNEL